MSSVDGLVSGLNTSDIIRQLMQLERQPVVRLQSRKTAADRAITALQGLNTKFLALTDLARKLSGTGGWNRAQATSSHPDLLSVAVAEGTAPTSLSFRVGSLAAAHQVYSAATYEAPGSQVAQPGRNITIASTAADGSPTSVVVADHDGTLESVAAAINAHADSPVVARLVKTSQAGDYRLELTAKQTGAASEFTVSGIRQPPTPEMSFAVATQASDAEILFGSSATPMSVTSTTNVFTDVAPGVTLTVRKADPATVVAVEVSRDSAAIAEDVEKLVTAANDLLKDIKSLTGFDAATKKGGLLRGSTAVRDLQHAILGAVSQAVGGASAAAAGLELTRDGSLKFDRAAFDKAYAADPAGVAAIFNGGAEHAGIAGRLRTIGEGATKFGTGTLTLAMEARRSEVRRIDDTIATWDVRLAAKEARFRRQFAALEAALGSAQQQGNWLAGQISALPRMRTDY